MQLFGERAHVRVEGGGGDADGARSFSRAAADAGAVEAPLTRALRDAGLDVTSVRPIRTSLEDMFIARLARGHHETGHRVFVDLACGAATPAAAQAPLRLTLDEAMARGLDASHRLAETRARGEAAEAAVGGERAAAMPRIAAQAGYMRTNHVDEFGLLTPDNQFRVIYPDVPDNYRTRLDLQWPIYTGGRIDALERAARAEAAASSGDLGAARADLRLEITRASWALATAARRCGSSTNRSARCRRTCATCATGSPRGSCHRTTSRAWRRRSRASGCCDPGADQATWPRRRSRAWSARRRARRSCDLAGRAAGRGDDAGAGARRGGQGRPPRARGAGKPGRGGGEARRGRGRRPAPDGRRGRRLRLRPAQPADLPARRRLEQLVGRQLNVAWPIWDGGRTRADVARAAAAARAVGERLAEFDRGVALEVRQRVLELASSRAAIEAAADGVRAAAEARRVVGDRYDAGVATSTDVLDAQVALLQAELDRTRAIATARLAEARLARAVGR